MLTRLHPFTTLGLLLVLISPVFFLAADPRVGIVLLFLAYGFTAVEFQKYTSDYQFGMLLITGTAMGISLDLLFLAWPVLTLSMFIAALATIIRQRYMQWFTYVDFLWLDTGLSLVALAMYVLAVHDMPFAWALWLPPLLPLIGAVGLTFSYLQDGRHLSRRVRNGYRVKTGEPAPDFTLPDQDGAPVALAGLIGQHPLLLVFVRGDWCPGCHMMLRTYERNREIFRTKGVQVVAIGPDDISVNKSMVERIGVGYRLLSDTAQEVSRQYGVVYTNPALEMAVDYAAGIPLPASFLIDSEGIIRYVSRPDRLGEFLDPSLIFGVLDQLPAKGEAAWN